MKSNDPELRYKQIRVIGADNQQLGVMPLDQATSLARAAELDLVLVADRSDPPVCRIMNFGKFAYEKKKREREGKRLSQVAKLKEVKFRANIDEHDYHVKVSHILAFIEEGCRVKVSLQFRGREMAHREIGVLLLERVTKDCGEKVTVESMPRMMGRTLTMQLAPK